LTIAALMAVYEDEEEKRLKRRRARESTVANNSNAEGCMAKTLKVVVETIFPGIIKLATYYTSSMLR